MGFQKQYPHEDSGVPIGGLQEFSTDVSVLPPDYLSTSSAQTLLQSAFPELYDYYGLIADRTPADLWVENSGGVPGSDSLQAVAFGDGLWVAVGNNGTVWTASDPTGTWTENTSVPSSETLYDVLYDETDGWLIVGNNGTVWTASDPTGTWTENTNLPARAAQLRSVVKFGTYYVAAAGNVASNKYVWYATDPSGTWTEQLAYGAGASSTVLSVATDGETLVLAGQSGQVYYTTDPTSGWFLNSNVPSTSITTLSMTVTPDGWIAAGSGFAMKASAPDGAWSFISGLTGPYVDAFYDDSSGLAIISGASGALLTSSTPSGPWTQNPSPPTSGLTFNGIARNSDFIVAVGNTGALWTCTRFSYNKSTQFIVTAIPSSGAIQYALRAK